MKLSELITEAISQEQAFQKINASFEQWVRGHLDHDNAHNTRSINGGELGFAPAIMTLVRQFMPEAVYTGQLYRIISLETELIERSSNVAQIMSQVKNFRHAHGLPYYAWADTRSGVEDIIQGGGDEDEGFPFDDADVALILTQNTSFGISIAKVVEYLKDAGINPGVNTRAAVLGEVIAPIDTSVQAFEFMVTHGGDQPMYDENDFDDDMDDDERDELMAAMRTDRTSFRPSEFARMKKMIAFIKHNRAEDTNGFNKDNYYNKHPLRKGRVSPWEDGGTDYERNFDDEGNRR